MFLKEPNFIIIGVILTLLTVFEGNAQSSPAEIDTLFYRGIALGNSNLDSTLSIASDLVTLSKEFHDEYGEVKAKILASYVYFSRLKLDTARFLLRECEHWFQSHTEYYYSQNHGRVQLYQTRLSARKQEFGLARLSGKEALGIFRTIKDEKYEAEALSALGIIEYLTENYAEALRYYLDAVKIKSKLSDETERLAPDILLNISQVYSRMGQFENARVYARRSLRARAYNMTPEAGNIYNSIGAYHNSENHFDSAIYYYSKGREIADSNHLLHMVFVADYNIANVYNRSGDYRKSLRAIVNGLKNTSVPAGMLETTWQLIAKNYLSLGRYDSAILTARKTFRAHVKRNSKQGIITDSNVLSSAFVAIGRKDSAIHYLKIKNAYQDSIYGPENQKRLSTLYAEMETIAKEKEIEILERETDLTVAQKKILQLSIGSGVILMPLLVTGIVLYFRHRAKQQKLLSIQLNSELDLRKKNLHQHALRMIYMNNGLSEIEEAMKKIKSDGSDKFHEIQHTFSQIQFDRSLEREWEHFDKYFGNVHVGFYDRFNIRFPALTLLEKRLAGLVRMNLTNSEIAGLLNIETKSVKMAKYRLKKKLELSDEQDMLQFLQTFG